ncbi:MAG: DNA repair protein RecN [Kineosporiaceae bacterium]|nr:DNA repair protein RecN [Kineosporiaceae bacterium]
MRLRGLGVINEAVLELGPGLTVVTGETGAGKTMVVTGLGLLFGGRADAGAVRSGQSSALVEGRIAIPSTGVVAERVREAGAELDELDDGAAELIVSRTVGAEGRSRGHVGGRSAPVSLLAELAEDLIAVHGQSEQLRLRSTTRQRQTLDRFAGAEVAEPLAGYRERWQRLRVVEEELHEIRTQARERAQEAELLRLGLAEVERVDPRPGEDQDLRAESERLGHAEELRTASAIAQAALTGREDTAAGEPDAVALLTSARQALDQVREHDAQLAGLADRLRELCVLATDVAAECASYTERIEADPARLAAVEERRSELSGLTRAYGPDLDAVLEWARSSGLRLLELDGDQDRSLALVTEREELRTELGALAARISRARRLAAGSLGEAVSRELTELAMPHAELVVEVRQRPDEQGLGVELDGSPQLLAAGPDGVDEVELLLVPHRGAPARPLAKGASGGELSRVMLGLEVVLGGADPVPTFVFDEVDAGVGGQAALGIGRRLARLARTAQVLVVTHLPQVAAYADRHLVVTKAVSGEVTESGVTHLDRNGRVRELARMLGGLADSDSAQAHAEELLATAGADRALDPPGSEDRARRGTIVA